MKFLSHGIGELVLKELRKASEARLAVAFFNPDNRMLDALAGLPKLKLIVSEEFAFTNPYKLEKLKLDLLPFRPMMSMENSTRRSSSSSGRMAHIGRFSDRRT